MTSCHTFARGVLFAVTAALLWIPWAIVAGPVLGLWEARALYLVGVTALYVGSLANRGSRRLPVVVLAAGVAGGFSLIAGTTTELAFGMAAIIGLARSGLVYRVAPARAVVTEVLLLPAGLLFAGQVGGFTLLSTALGIWAFFLVQSLYFLAGPRAARSSAGPSIDRFEEAYRNAIRILDRA